MLVLLAVASVVIYYLISFISEFKMSGSDFFVCVVLVRYITDLIHMEKDIQFGR
jgi:hypothetical protein